MNRTVSAVLVCVSVLNLCVSGWLVREVVILARKSEIALGREEAKAIKALGSELIAAHGGNIREAYKAQAKTEEAEEAARKKRLEEYLAR